MPELVWSSEFTAESMAEAGMSVKIATKPLVARSSDRKKTHLPHRQGLAVRVGEVRIGVVVRDGVSRLRLGGAARVVTYRVTRIQVVTKTTVL